MDYLIWFTLRTIAQVAVLALFFIWKGIPYVPWVVAGIGCFLILRELLLYIEWSCTKLDCRPWHYHYSDD